MEGINGETLFRWMGEDRSHDVVLNRTSKHCLGGGGFGRMQEGTGAECSISTKGLRKDMSIIL